MQKKAVGKLMSAPSHMISNPSRKPRPAKAKAKVIGIKPTDLYLVLPVSCTLKKKTPLASHRKSRLRLHHEHLSTI